MGRFKFPWFSGKSAVIPSYDSLEDALKDAEEKVAGESVSMGNVTLKLKVGGVMPVGCGCEVMLVEGRINVYATVRVAIISSETSNIEHVIYGSGGEAISGRSSFSADDIVAEFDLRRMMGYLAGGKDYYRLLKRRDAKALAQLEPLGTVLANIYFLSEMQKVAPAGSEQSSEIAQQRQMLDALIGSYEPFTPVSKV